MWLDLDSFVTKSGRICKKKYADKLLNLVYLLKVHGLITMANVHERPSINHVIHKILLLKCRFKYWSIPFGEPRGFMNDPSLIVICPWFIKAAVKFQLRGYQEICEGCLSLHVDKKKNLVGIFNLATEIKSEMLLEKIRCRDKFQPGWQKYKFLRIRIERLRCINLSMLRQYVCHCREMRSFGDNCWILEKGMGKGMDKLKLDDRSVFKNLAA